MKKQVSSPFIVFVPVIPDGITHDFVVLTNKKAQTAFSPFGLTVLATLRVAHRFLTLTNTKTRTVFAPFGFVTVELAGIGGATHQQGFSEHSPRKPLARANAQPAFATSPRQPLRANAHFRVLRNRCR